MTGDERAQALVTGRLLLATARLDALGTGLTLIAAAACVVRGSSTCARPNLAAASAALALGILSKLYASRISFDARLFEDVASASLTTSELDFALDALGLRKADGTVLPWADRCRGAKRLTVVCAAIIAAQAAAIVLLGIA